MEWSKVKNIIILILLIVNIFLLVQTAQQERQSQQYREDARSGAVEVLRQQGYEVGPDALPEEKKLAALTAERDRESEGRMAEELLGAVQKNDDGVRVSYTGEKGECSFRSNGSFSATFTAGAYPVEGEVGRHAVKFLTGVGYPCELLEVDEGEEETVVTVRQTWEGASLFSCTTELIYRDGELKSFEGNRLFGAPAQDSSGGEAMDVATALVRFMGGMREGGHVFTKIERLDAGYLVAGSGRKLQMEPTWRVTTDAGTFLMNGVTGELNPE